MKELRYTLLSDGSSDRALLPILTWLLREHGVRYAIQPEWADLRRVHPRASRKLPARILKSIELFPCDLLFVHRDAEKESHDVRQGEIREAVEEAGRVVAVPVTVCVIPVRMQEAWLLFDELAIRRAAGNPHGQQLLTIPDPTRLESLPDPKATLYDLLRVASGHTGRRLKRLAVNVCASRLTQFMHTFAPLRALPAFKKLEETVGAVVQKQGWL